jgi:oxygen-independent coproporphyrinogen-3 oxidase
MGHTTQAGVDLLGFGPSAISELRGSYAQNQRDLGPWQEAAETAGIATMRGHRLSPDDIERRWIIGRIMCLGELRADEYEARFGRELRRVYAPELARLEDAVRDGLVDREADGSLVMTPLGRLFVRNVAMAFDAYLPEQRRSGQQMFSKTV